MVLNSICSPLTVNLVVATDIDSYYNFDRSTMYTVLLDATKAFDRVNYRLSENQTLKNMK